jgi:DNA polymerase-4
MEHYAAVSREIFAIFSEFTDLVEPLSCDEAFLDVTGNFLGEPSATRIARLLRRRIWQKTGLTASAGVSYNLFLAKVASGMRKPNGLSVIPPESAAAFIDALPVHKFYGIGRVTAEKLATRQIFSGADLKRLSPQAFRDLFGKTATYYERILRGEDDRPVCPHRDRKSLGRETTFPEDLKTMEDAHAAIHRLAGDVATALQMENLRGRTLTLKVRYGNFESITRSQTFSHFFSDEPSIAQTAETLLHERTQGPGRPIRLLGISVSEFQPKKFTARFVRSALVQGEFAFQDA